MLVFEESEKPEYPEKTSRSKGENQQQTQPTYAATLGFKPRPQLWDTSALHHSYSPPLPPPPRHKDNY